MCYVRNVARHPAVVIFDDDVFLNVAVATWNTQVNRMSRSRSVLAIGGKH